MPSRSGRHPAPTPSLGSLSPNVVREIARLTNARGHASMASASTSLRRDLSSMDPFEFRRKATIEKMERRLSPTYDAPRRVAKAVRRHVYDFFNTSSRENAPEYYGH